MLSIQVIYTSYPQLTVGKPLDPLEKGMHFGSTSESHTTPPLAVFLLIFQTAQRVIPVLFTRWSPLEEETQEQNPHSDLHLSPVLGM